MYHDRDHSQRLRMTAGKTHKDAALDHIGMFDIADHNLSPGKKTPDPTTPVSIDIFKYRQFLKEVHYHTSRAKRPFQFSRLSYDSFGLRLHVPTTRAFPKYDASGAPISDTRN